MDAQLQSQNGITFIRYILFYFDDVVSDFFRIRSKIMYHSAKDSQVYDMSMLHDYKFKKQLLKSQFFFSIDVSPIRSISVNINYQSSVSKGFKDNLSEIPIHSDELINNQRMMRTGLALEQSYRSPTWAEIEKSKDEIKKQRRFIRKSSQVQHSQILEFIELNIGQVRQRK